MNHPANRAERRASKNAHKYTDRSNGWRYHAKRHCLKWYGWFKESAQKFHKQERHEDERILPDDL